MVGIPTTTLLNNVKQDIIQWIAKALRVFLVKYETNDIEEDSATVTYICMEDDQANWWIKKIDTSVSNAFTHASIKNNPTITTYTDAHTGRAALTYGGYSSAF